MKDIKARDVSTVSKIIGVLILISGFFLKATGIIECETNDILKIGFACTGICGTVDINIILDKIFKKD